MTCCLMISKIEDLNLCVLLMDIWFGHVLFLWADGTFVLLTVVIELSWLARSRVIDWSVCYPNLSCWANCLNVFQLVRFLTWCVELFNVPWYGVMGDETLERREGSSSLMICYGHIFLRCIYTLFLVDIIWGFKLTLSVIAFFRLRFIFSSIMLLITFLSSASLTFWQSTKLCILLYHFKHYWHFKNNSWLKMLLTFNYTIKCSYYMALFDMRLLRSCFSCLTYDSYKLLAINFCNFFLS